MEDNFDLKKFLVENKLGAYSKINELNYGSPAEIPDISDADVEELSNKISPEDISTFWGFWLNNDEEYIISTLTSLTTGKLSIDQFKEETIKKIADQYKDYLRKKA